MNEFGVVVVAVVATSSNTASVFKRMNGAQPTRNTISSSLPLSTWIVESHCVLLALLTVWRHHLFLFQVVACSLF